MEMFPAERTPTTGSQELVFLTNCTKHPQLLLIVLQALQLKSRLSDTEATTRPESDLKWWRADKRILVCSFQGRRQDAAPPGWGSRRSAVTSRRKHLQRQLKETCLCRRRFQLTEPPSASSSCRGHHFLWHRLAETIVLLPAALSVSQHSRVHLFLSPLAV